MEFDETFAVVVVGYGFPGTLAAITAADQGATVLLAEKPENPGGMSICSGGAMRSAHDADEVARLARISNATVEATGPDAVGQLIDRID